MCGLVCYWAEVRHVVAAMQLTCSARKDILAPTKSSEGHIQTLQYLHGIVQINAQVYLEVTHLM